MKKYICIVHIAAILLTGCGLTRLGQVVDVPSRQFEIQNKFSDYLEGCQEFVKDRDKYVNCFQTALENDPSMNFNFDDKVRQVYLNWECNNMPEYSEQDKYEACIDNAHSTWLKEFSDY
ncbi:MAG: hypothetical protein AAF349_25580 [Cyanobacteria bacterium P01_A01_bin.68]